MTSQDVFWMIVGGALFCALVVVLVCLIAALKAAGRADDTRFADLEERRGEGNGRGIPPRP